MKVTLIPVAALATFALFGCNKSDENKVAEFKKPEVIAAGNLEDTTPKNMFPNKVGTQITYELTSGNGKKEITFSVKKVTPIDGGNDVTIEIMDEGKTADTTVWRENAKGLSQVSVRNGKAFNPPQMLLPYPIKFSVPTDYKGTGPFAVSNNSGPIEGQTRVRGMETVETAIGEIEAVAVQAVYRWKTDGNVYISTETAWIAPKYGLVRFQQSIAAQNAKQEIASQSQSLVMKNFSEKG